MKPQKAIVIGSGVAGLASSIRLAIQGYETHVYESYDKPGGKLNELTLGSYRFDTGPSLFTLPSLIKELYELCGQSFEDQFPFERLETTCRYHYEDGTQFNAHADRKTFAKELEQVAQPQEIDAFFKHLDRAQFRYSRMAPIFLDRSLHRWKNYANRETLQGVGSIPRLNLFSDMNSENKKQLGNPYLVQYFNRFATYNGSDPFQAPALLNMIPHLEHNIGTFFPKNGMYQIAQSLYDLALSQGVQFHFNTRIEAILHEPSRVYGIRTRQSDKPILADLVVSNADIHSTYQQLMPKAKAPKRLLKQEKSSSGLVFYWGVKQRFPKLQLHNIFFSQDYQAEFKGLFETGETYKDPTVYVHISSKCNPNDAPPNGENWFVMINVPNTKKAAKPLDIPMMRSLILAKLSRMLGVDMETLIECESYLDPETLEKRTSSYAGALYGNASNNRFAAFLRHKNYSSDFKGLYFCGGSVHPGGGIPLCLQSAKIVADLVAQRERRN
jgi:phytoene desaturase